MTPSKLRFDLDDLNICFPEIHFPDLDLSQLRKLPWPNLSGGARMFRRIASAVNDTVDVDIATTATKPTLADRPVGSRSSNGVSLIPTSTPRRRPILMSPSNCTAMA